MYTYRYRYRDRYRYRFIQATSLSALHPSKIVQGVLCTDVSTPSLLVRPQPTGLGTQTHHCSEADLNSSTSHFHLTPAKSPSSVLTLPGLSAAVRMADPHFFMKTSILWAFLTRTRLAFAYFTASSSSFPWTPASLETLGVSIRWTQLSFPGGKCTWRRGRVHCYSWRYLLYTNDSQSYVFSCISSLKSRYIIQVHCCLF